MKAIFPKRIGLAGLSRVIGALLLFAVGSLVSAQPVFTTQPRSRTVAEGTHFYVSAYAGTGDFDWYHDGQKLPSQHSVYYAIAAARPSDAGGYYQIACNSAGCSTSQVAQITVVPGGSLSQWERTWPDGVTAPLGLLAYGNGHYVTAAWDSGNADTVVSDDGINWADSGDHFGLYYGGIVFAQNQFVVVGGEDNGPGTVLTSTDGHEWERAFTDSHWDYFSDLQFDNGVYAMVASAEEAAPGLLRSTNAVEWVPVPQSLYHLVVSRGIWLGVSGGYPEVRVALSTNALDWTNRIVEGVSGDYFRGLVAGPDKFVTFGTYSVAWSEDGVNWSNAEIPQAPANPAFIRSIVYGSNGYVGMVSGFCEPTLCFYPYMHTINSADGIHWTLHPFPVDTDLGSVSFAGGLYIATGYQGAIFTSPDGLNWTQRAGYSTRQLHAMAASSKGAVAVGERGLILSSSDGASWTRHNGLTRDDLYAIQFQNGRYVAAGGSGRSLLAESSNGENWSFWTDAAGGSLRGIAGDGVNLVAVGLRGSVVKSSGPTWTRNEAPGLPDFRGVALLNGYYVAIAYPEPSGYPPPPTPGSIYTSEDGEDDWTLRATNQLAFYGIASGNGRAVIVGAAGTVLVSTDGINWTSSDIGVGDHILSVDFVRGVFVAGSRDGNIFSSADGVNWIGRDLGLQPYYYAQPTIGWIGHAFNHVFGGGGAEEMWRSGLLGPELKVIGIDQKAGFLRCTIEAVQAPFFRIQHSTDFASWRDIGTYSNLPPSKIVFMPANLNGPTHFFRAVEP